MTTIRSRRTNTFFAKELSGKISPVERLAQTSHSEVDEAIDDFLKDFSSRLPEDKKAEVTRQVRQACLEHKDQIQELITNPDRTLQLVKHAEEALRASQTPSIVSHMGKLLITAKLASFMPAAGLALALLPAAAAATGIQYHEGQPSGGSDLCSSYTLGCIQGYLTDGTNPWNTSMPQYNRVVTQAGSESDLSIYAQLRDCMSPSTMGNMAVNAYEKGTSAVKQVFAAQTSIWHGYQVQTQITNLPQDAGPIYQNDFMATGGGCMSWSGALMKAGAIAGIVIGGVAGLALIGFGIYYAKNKYCNRQRHSFTPGSIV